MQASDSSIAWWTPSPLKRQSRRIFQVFMREKEWRTSVMGGSEVSDDSSSSAATRARCDMHASFPHAMDERIDDPTSTLFNEGLPTLLISYGRVLREK